VCVYDVGATVEEAREKETAAAGEANGAGRVQVSQLLQAHRSPRARRVAPLVPSLRTDDLFDAIYDESRLAALDYAADRTENHSDSASYSYSYSSLSGSYSYSYDEYDDDDDSSEREHWRQNTIRRAQLNSMIALVCILLTDIRFASTLLFFFFR